MAMSNTTNLLIMNKLAALGRRFSKLFNWGDPQWGRPADNKGNDSKDPKNSDETQGSQTGGGGSGGDNNEPPERDPNKRDDEQKKPDPRESKDNYGPDPEEMWKNLNDKFNKLFGGKNKNSSGNRPSNNQNNMNNDDRNNQNDNDGWGSGGNNNHNNGGNNKGFGQMPRPRMPQMSGKGMGKGGIVIIVLALGAWLASGFFTVKEGRQAVVLTFGKVTSTVGPGLHWRWPAPIEETIEEAAEKLRTVEIGEGKTITVTGLRDTDMLTKDKSIVNVDFSVQFMITNLNDFLFTNKDPEIAVAQAAEAAVRDVASQSLANDMLKDERTKIRQQIKESIQSQLDILNIGIKIDEVNIKNVVVPSQVQPAVDDVLKATSERTSLINEGEIYASYRVPLANGVAAQLIAEAKAYEAKTVAEAEGDAQRFVEVYESYKNAPEVTRERMYLEAMQTIFTNVTKIVVDTQSNSMLYLPLDKIISGENIATQNSDASNDAKFMEQRVISGGAVQQKAVQQNNSSATTANNAASGTTGRQTRY